MRRHTKFSLSAISLTMAAAAFHGDACAQQGYGYPQQSGPAAPSTIPGQGDSSARVPTVDSAPTPMPKPRKPKPGAKPSPWGSTPPVATQPPVGSQPPTGTSPGSGGNSPPPAQSTPTPTQPQGGASDRLTGTFRGSSGVGGSAVSRKGDAGGGIEASAQRTTSAALACTKNANTPTVTRIRPASDASLKPGASFVIEGLCFGDTAGKVKVTLPTPYGRIQEQQAMVLDWDSAKIVAQLPEGIVKATPGDAAVEVASAGGTRGAAKDFAFEPRWERVTLASEGRVLKCMHILWNKCVIGRDVVADQGFKMRGNVRGGFGSEAKIDARATLGGQVYSGNDLDDGDARGEHRYEVALPPSARLSGCRASTESFETTRGIPDAVVALRVEGNVVTVAWTLRATGQEGWLSYSVYCEAVAPAGVAQS